MEVRTSRGPSLYTEITNKIIADLTAGIIPWAQPWKSSSLGIPRNGATGRSYSGINILLLWRAATERGYSQQRWVTFRQALSSGGNVRKGERGTMIVYADRFTPEDERRRAAQNGDVAAAIPFLKRFTVFNVDQCEGLSPENEAAALPNTELILPAAEALIRATKADFRFGGSTAFYSPAADFVQVPPPEAFFEPIDWHRTAFHELAHWTGAGHRLERDQSGTFGSNAYAREELVAEMGGAFVCASLGIVPTVRHADYIGFWLDVLREDHRAILRAASAASKAADHLLSFQAEPPVIATIPKEEEGFGFGDGS